jgi:hypothetical protein
MKHVFVECLKLLDARKQAKLQWLQNPVQITGDSLSNVRRKTNIMLKEKGIPQRRNE